MQPNPGDEAWAELVQLFMRDENHEQFLAACEAVQVGPPALKMLLGMEPGVATPMRAFANKMRCDASWVTSLVDDLEALGYVERRILPTDRRVKTIVITRAGITAQNKAKRVLHKAPPALDVLPKSEQRQLRDLLRKVRAASAAQQEAAG